MKENLYRDLECPHVDCCRTFDEHIKKGTFGTAPCEDSTKYIVHEEICYKSKN